MAKNVNWKDWAYLALGIISTWWLTKEERGENPGMHLMWTGVKVCRSVRAVLYRTETSLMNAIDKELENGHRS